MLHHNFPYHGAPHTFSHTPDATTDSARSPTYKDDELVNYSDIRQNGHTSFASARASFHNSLEARALLRFTRMFVGSEGLRDNAEVYRAIALSYSFVLNAVSPSFSSSSIHFLFRSTGTRYTSPSDSNVSTYPRPSCSRASPHRGYRVI